ncbi:citramalate synthase [Egicoccus halophilus]|uniref:Citramalate synthase n=1 Tax=Egicoccus halophilus TaxID=1670830 RepID=A0A8J3A899_9ACTN|nr:citramalate synthase [Egicoccus halophilus]GGI06356.1 (R)-citramalate synthase [Egicoccus halophilus]
MTDATAHSPLPAPAAGLDLYDTTLRDGTQREGVSLSVEDKLRVARRMDELGVAYIEGGWPGANPKDTAFFARAADGELALEHATLVAFGMTRGAGRPAEADPLLQALVDARTEVICLVGKSWGYHVDEALGVPRAENLAMVADSVRHLTSLGKRVFFDAEHFFDGVARDGAYAREVVTAAAEAGAECVVLCDTNGGAMPWDVAELVGGLVHDLPSSVGLHFHDDGGCAVANSLLGIEAGATHVQGTANGLGERCGNANLFTILADLQLKRGLRLVPPDRLERLTEISHTVAELCNQTTPSVAPYVGHTAFSHKAGLHASALAKAPDMYQHVEPEDVGNRQRLVVSELAGRSNIVLKARELGVAVDDEQARTVLAEVKRREAAGWTYEAADASFDLLLRRVTGSLPAADEPFRSRHYRVSVAGGADEASAATEGPAEAILAVEVAGQRRLGAGEGNGPVDALDRAFRNAVNGTWPQLDRVHLSDYKVRVLEASAGTDAVTRVLVTSTDGVDVWDTVGVHPNVVEASWLALSDAYTHAILRVHWQQTAEV